jgi:hypothetical protein
MFPEFNRYGKPKNQTSVVPETNGSFLDRLHHSPKMSQISESQVTQFSSWKPQVATQVVGLS